MSAEKLKLIQKLMDELITDMEPTQDDYMEKLGKKKPEIEVVKMEGKLPLGEMEDDMEGMDHEMGDESMDFSSIMNMDKEDEEESDLKKKLMKIKGM